MAFARREPLVVGFEAGAEIELTLDATLLWLGGQGGKPVVVLDDLSAVLQAVVAGFTAVETKLTSLLPILAGGGPAILAAAALKKTMAK